jgi:D-aminopeptidase
MMDATPSRLGKVLQVLPQRYAGPGGALAILRDGAVLEQHCWGWADMARRLPFTPQTPFPVCSITKQFTCALLLDQFPDPTVLDGDVRRYLPTLQGKAPGIVDLCNNQSGLRDYWALAMLCGAPVEGVFGPEDARWLIGRAETLHFAPGTRSSYCNQNFRIVSDMVADRAGQDFATLLRERVLALAGMPRAALNPDTSSIAGGTLGYEGTAEKGFRAAVNRIHWTGDAGLAASLEDMIAWERFIDATRDDAEGLYHRLSRPQWFRDGAEAQYGFGLGHGKLHRRRATSHGGGLRGFSSFRAYLPEERISVVVLFNHLSEARAAALDLLGAVLDEMPEPEPEAPLPPWAGRYVEAETGLAVCLEAEGKKFRLHYASRPEMLAPAADGAYTGSGTVVRQVDGALRMERRPDNLSAPLIPCESGETDDVEGTFHASELASDITCVRAGSVLYGACSGPFGQGEMHALLPFGPDRFLMSCPRALDHTAPGDWTLHFHRNSAGRVAGLTAGCWLARGVQYVRR